MTTTTHHETVQLHGPHVPNDQRTTSTRPKAIDLFCGAGGLSLGIEMAGFDVVAGVEVDPVHAATHLFNFPDASMVVKSVSDVTGSELLALAGLGVGELDLLAGGAPCQGFSLMGKRALDDPRNGLVRDFIRLIEEVKPRYFLFENVKGLTVGKHKQFLEEIVEMVGAAGYQVVLPWKVLDAVNYGVPQSRKRLFLLGYRDDCKAPKYPEPITSHPTKGAEGSLPPAPTCEQALSDIPDAEQFDVLIKGATVPIGTWPNVSDYVRTLRPTTQDAWGSVAPREWDPSLLTSSARTNHTAVTRRRFAETAPGSSEPISHFYKLHPDGVCNTLRAGTPSKRGAFTSPRPIHFEHGRCITVREMARLHGYPDWFEFHSTKWNGGRQVGNSVPPPLAAAVAGQIRKALGGQLCIPGPAGPRPSRGALRLTHRTAARFFGVVPGANTRDRKASYRKPTQSDVEARGH